MMQFWKSLAGLVEVEITSADTGAAFQAINACEIPVYHAKQVGNLTARFEICRADYRKLAALMGKRGEKLKICKRRGIYWSIRKLITRPVLLTGLAIFLALVFTLPTRILFVQVEGNHTVPQNQILAAAESCGISFLASRREVRSEKMKNALLSAVPQLQWAGINTYGCVAVISVREKADSVPVPSESQVASIVAARDGLIDSITVTRGNALCATGQVVKEGQVLISGYKDCGIYIQATRAEGEVYGRTYRNLDTVTPSVYMKRETATQKKQKYSLLVGKKRINLWKDSGIWPTTCGRMYEEYYITLPGGFRLPIAFVRETFTFYEMEESETEQTDAQNLLSCFAEDYIASQMVAGQILQKREFVRLEDGAYCLNGQYLCREMIGRVRTEQIGE
jgi:sporulation protein YqfD